MCGWFSDLARLAIGRRRKDFCNAAWLKKRGTAVLRPDKEIVREI
jgi:hypothetical protein